MVRLRVWSRMTSVETCLSAFCLGSPLLPAIWLEDGKKGDVPALGTSCCLGLCVSLMDISRPGADQAQCVCSLRKQPHSAVYLILSIHPSNLPHPSSHLSQPHSMNLGFYFSSSSPASENGFYFYSLEKPSKGSL